jgi:hypothetical protein
MTKTPLLITALLVALAGPVHAQATASNDPIVQMRAEQRAANKTYAEKKHSARADRDAKIKAAVDSAVADAKAQGKDPLVAKRDATAKAKAATRADYEATMKTLKQEHDAAMAAAKKTGAK